MPDKKNHKHVYYAGISEPVDVRKSILEASKEVLQSLQQFDKFSAVRRDKKQAIVDLKANVSEITKLLSELKTHLPSAVQVQAIKPAAQKHSPKTAAAFSVKQKSKKLKEAPAKLKPKELSELEKLEKELGEIENKLGNMS